MTEEIVFLHKENAKSIGRMCIKKSFFTPTYIDSNISRPEYMDKYGVTKKVIENTLKFLCTPEERKQSMGRKIAAKQRKHNSNFANKGKPNKMLDSHKLKEYVDIGEGLYKIASNFGVCAETVKNNIDYSNTISEGNLKLRKFLKPSDIVALSSIEKIIGISLLGEFEKAPHERNADLLIKEFGIIEEALLDIKHYLSKFKRRLFKQNAFKDKANLHRCYGSKINGIIGSVFKSEGYNIVYEYEIQGKYFDVYFKDFNLLIEIDPIDTHTTDECLFNDNLKNNIAISNGYLLYRFVVDSKYRYDKVKKEAIKCLEKLKSAGLLH